MAPFGFRVSGWYVDETFRPFVQVDEKRAWIHGKQNKKKKMP